MTTGNKTGFIVYDEASEIPKEIWELGLPMPGTEAKPAEPAYTRFLCLNGEFEGRGLIVPMPATYAWGYDLVTLKDGTHVALAKEPEACSVS